MFGIFDSFVLSIFHCSTAVLRIVLIKPMAKSSENSYISSLSCRHDRYTSEAYKQTPTGNNTNAHRVRLMKEVVRNIVQGKFQYGVE